MECEIIGFATSNFWSRTELLSHLLFCLLRLISLLNFSTGEISRCYFTERQCLFQTEDELYSTIFLYCTDALNHISHGFTVHLIKLSDAPATVKHSVSVIL